MTPYMQEQLDIYNDTKGQSVKDMTYDEIYAKAQACAHVVSLRAFDKMNDATRKNEQCHQIHAKIKELELHALELHALELHALKIARSAAIAEQRAHKEWILCMVTCDQIFCSD